ncbi:MAG: 23S rRNA (guanosine(2251)-2'-O)-methyltransferase RlmB [Moorellales bacterium]
MEEELLVGVHSVLEALRAGRPLNKIWVATGPRRPEMREILALARERRVPVQKVERGFLKNLAGSLPAQGVAAQAAPVPYLDLEEVMEGLGARPEPPLLLALDQVEDPQNLGAILRSAEATGVDAVILPQRRAAPVTAAVARASAGAVAYLQLIRVPNLARALERLGDQGITVVGLEAEAERNLFSLDLRGPLALVAGGEARGLRRLVKEKCQYLARLPMRGRVTSLNASAATAVALYEVLRQRCFMNIFP